MDDLETAVSKSHHSTNHSLDNHAEHTIYEELVCHLPYAIFSVAIGLVFLSVFSYVAMNASGGDREYMSGAHVLFHSFHFVHIVFAATGTLITFLRFSKNWMAALVVGIVSPMIFCTLSDIVFPTLAGRMLGIPMKFHLCFVDEIHDILPFLLVGIINGFVMSWHHSGKQVLYSIFSHVGHILIGSFAASFYLFSQGLIDWSHNVGLIFILLILAVVVPCTVSDLVVPIVVARMSGTKKCGAKK